MHKGICLLSNITPIKLYLKLVSNNSLPLNCVNGSKDNYERTLVPSSLRLIETHRDKEHIGVNYLSNTSYHSLNLTIMHIGP